MRTEKPRDRFREVLKRGPYLFHVHTTLTDGQNTLGEYVAAAKRLGFQSLIVTEHIRRKPTYEFSALLDDAKVFQTELTILVGVEAKVMIGGAIDVPLEILPKLDVLGIAEHSFPGNAFDLADALKNVFRDLRHAPFTRVWLHPGNGLLKKGATENLLKEVLQVALDLGVYIEENLRYRLPPKPLTQSIPRSRKVVGIDAHSVKEVEHFAAEVQLRLEAGGEL